jgi:NAD+ kinase
MTARRSRRRFKRVGLVLKAYTKGLVDHGHALHRQLERAGAQVVVDQQADSIFPKAETEPVAKMDVDLIVTLGGDGTILRVLQQNKAPVFAVNAGIMGFLAEAPLASAEASLARVLRGDFVEDRRMRLQATLNGRRLAACLNEVVLHTSTVAKMIHFEVSRRDSIVERVRADGLIIATPTGSTSYNLSVGGPIIDPEVRAFVLSPIAPFTLNSRPIVAPAEDEMVVRMVADRGAKLVLDGQVEEPFTSNDELLITRAARDAVFLRFSRDFYRRLHEKHAIQQ